MTNSIRMLGIARKAGFLEIGEEASGTAARTGTARLILSASDASENSRHRATNFANLAGVPNILLLATKYELGAAVGKGTPAMVTITDIGLAASFVSKLNREESGKYQELEEILTKKAERILMRRKKTHAAQDNIRTGKRRK